MSIRIFKNKSGKIESELDASESFIEALNAKGITIDLARQDVADMQTEKGVVFPLKAAEHQYSEFDILPMSIEATAVLPNGTTLDFNGLITWLNARLEQIERKLGLSNLVPESTDAAKRLADLVLAKPKLKKG